MDTLTELEDSAGLRSRTRLQGPQSASQGSFPVGASPALVPGSHKPQARKAGLSPREKGPSSVAVVGIGRQVTSSLWSQHARKGWPVSGEGQAHSQESGQEAKGPKVSEK